MTYRLFCGSVLVSEFDYLPSISVIRSVISNAIGDVSLYDMVVLGCSVFNFDDEEVIHYDPVDCLFSEKV